MGKRMTFTTVEAESPEMLGFVVRGVVELARYDYGHAGDTGTMAEVIGVEIVNDEPDASMDRQAVTQYMKQEEVEPGIAYAFRFTDEVWVIGAWCAY